MGSNLNKDNLSENELGIVPRSLKYLFKCFNSCEDYEFHPTMSMIELYNEEIIDLFNYKNPSKNFNLREDKNGQFFITGLTESSISNAEEALNMIQTGTQNRKVAPTYSNEVSSRSHAIFMIFIEKVHKQTKEKTIFKINFVDLAGSERIKKSGATGERFKESVSINSGLLALSKVIMALADADKKTGALHIPYRESKLTRILKDSLGGNSITIMLACVSPSELNLEETVNTLNYASFARTIKIKPTQNVDLSENNNSKALIESLMKQIDDLKSEVQRLKEGKSKEVVAELGNIFNKRISEVVDGESSSEDEAKEDLDKKEKIDPKQFDELKNENKILKSIIKALRERESALLERISSQNNNIDKQNGITSEDILPKDKEEMPDAPYAEDFEKLKNEYFNHEKNVINDKLLKDLEEEQDISDIKITETNNAVLQQKEEEIKRLKNILREETKNKQGKQKVENNVSIINEKIRRLRDFQNTLKNKLKENEIYKNKLIKQKNEEIEIYKIDLLDKGKMVKALEQENIKNSQLLDEKNTTIANLKKQMRTKSVENLDAPRSSSRFGEILHTNESSSNLFKKKKTALAITKDDTPLSTTNNLIQIHNDDSSNNILLTKYNKKSSYSDLDQAYIANAKNIIKQIEDEMVKKMKLEKKLKTVFKEKNNFTNLISKLEEKYQIKINENNNVKAVYEQQLKLLELEDSGDVGKEKIQINNKMKILQVKIDNVNQRMEKISNIKNMTMNDLTNSENGINSQICQCEIRMSDLKYQLENNSSKLRPNTFITNNKSKLIYSPSKTNLQEEKKEDQEVSLGNDDSIDKIDLENCTQEKIIELDRVYKEKIDQLETKLKSLNEKVDQSNVSGETIQQAAINNQITYNNYIVNLNPVTTLGDSPPASPKKNNFESNTNVINISTKNSARKKVETKEEVKRTPTKLPTGKLPPKTKPVSNVTAAYKGRSSSIINKSYGSNSSKAGNKSEDK